jgi:acetyl esterase/lipase
MLRLTTILISFVLMSIICPAQDKLLYKQIDTTKLFLEVYYPDPDDSIRIYPAMVFFFGGGWVGGGTAQFAPHAKYFAKRGIVCFLA